MNRGWRVGLPQQTQVTIERKYDSTTGKELTQSEAACAERIRSLEEDLIISNNENRGLRERVIKAETIVSNIRKASESSHNKNPYPKTKTTSKSLNTELAKFCHFYKLKIDFPNEFFCPLTLDIMVDPVTTSGGHTYEWSKIAKWFKEGNNTDPKTGLKLNNKLLYPNHALRSAIRNFVPTCELIIITELHKNEVPNKTQGSIRMRSAPAVLVSKTRRQSTVKSSSKSRTSTTAKARTTETAPSSSKFIQELDARE